MWLYMQLTDSFKCMERRFNIFKVFHDIRKWISDIKNSIFWYQILFPWYQKFEFLIKKYDSFCDIKKSISLYQKSFFFYMRNWFYDMKNSNWLWYQELYFLISEIQITWRINITYLINTHWLRFKLMNYKARFAF